MKTDEEVRREQAEEARELYRRARHLEIDIEDDPVRAHVTRAVNALGRAVEQLKGRG